MTMHQFQESKSFEYEHSSKVQRMVIIPTLYAGNGKVNVLKGECC